MCVAIVEDEVMIAFMIQDVLNGFGIADTRLYHSFDEAMNAVETEDFEAVVLDLNLYGVLAVPIALRLKERAIPTLVVSSYIGSVASFDDLRDIPALAKPFTDDELYESMVKLGVLESLTSDSSSVDITPSDHGVRDAKRNNTPSLLPPLRQRH